MAPADVTAILERLAVIETKIDAAAEMAGRVRRLELLMTVLIVVVGAKLAGVSLPL